MDADTPSSLFSFPAIGHNPVDADYLEDLRRDFAPARPSEIFSAYWRFAAERQEIFFRRLSNNPSPWSDDPIMARYKFTNAYRASDRVSQYLIKHIIYTGEQTEKEVFFRVLLFKFFNRIETWERLTEAFGDIRYSSYRYADYDAVLSAILERGDKLFSAAYIMPAGNKQFGELRKHRNFLKLLEQMMAQDAPKKITDCRRMKDVYTLLRSYPLMGEFLAYQYTVDLNYSNLTCFSENDFVVAGPGAQSGIAKCFEHTGGLTASDVIALMVERQAAEFARLGITFRNLWGRPLQQIDCQNLFCELDKYARVAYPNIKGKSERTRIKQVFHPTEGPIAYWYPPKWSINQAVKSTLHANEN